VVVSFFFFLLPGVHDRGYSMLDVHDCASRKLLQLFSLFCSTVRVLLIRGIVLHIISCSRCFLSTNLRLQFL